LIPTKRINPTMKTKLKTIAKRLLEWFINLFRHIYAIKENDEIIGYVGMDGSLIPNDKT
jgi:hypothetical protein